MVEKIIVEGNLYGTIEPYTWVLNTDYEEILEDKDIMKLVFKNVVAEVKTDGVHVWLTVKAPKEGKTAIEYDPKTKEAKIYYTK